MFCLRCMRSALASTPIQAARPATPSTAVLRKPTKSAQLPLQWRRNLTLLSRPSLRPTLSPHTEPSLGSTQPLQSDSPSSTLLPAFPSAMGSLQVRGAIRDTFNPSHRVRKRRHGFLSRIKTRTGRKTLKRRLAKRRSTLSH